MTEEVAALATISLVLLGVAVWSRRLKARLRGSDEATSYYGMMYSNLHVVMFPLAAVAAVVALAMAASSLWHGGGTSELDVDDGCGSVDSAVRWLSSDKASDRRLGELLATAVWDRTLTDGPYTNALRRDCPVEVLTMLDMAGLSFSP